MKTIKTYDKLRNEIASFADDLYREFSLKIILTKRPLIGVRIPKIREIVSHVDKNSFTEIISYEPIAYEEVLARGMIIARLPFDKMCEYFDSQINFIDDWSTCDTFCSSIRPAINKHREEFLNEKIEPLLKSKQVFSIRAGLVLLKCCYITPDYLHLIFDRVASLADNDAYYVKMGIAWLLCDCFIKFPDETLSFLQNSNLTAWTYNKTISKIRDSYRVPKEAKDYLKIIRKKEHHAKND